VPGPFGWVGDYALPSLRDILAQAPGPFGWVGECQLPSLGETGLRIYLGADKGAVARALGVDFWSVV